MIMMGLGPFRFSIEDALLTRIERKLAARHADVDLVGRRPGSQFLGPGKETVELPAVIYPHFLGGNGLTQLEAMREAAELGLPQMLVAGTGRVLGLYTIRDVTDTRTFLQGNGFPMKVEIKIDLARWTPVGGGIGAGGIFTLFG